MGVSQVEPDGTEGRFDVAEMAIPTGKIAAAQPRNGSGRRLIGSGGSARE